MRSVLSLLLALGPVASFTATGFGATDTRSFVRAVSQSPALSAAARRAEAAHARVEAAGRLPDPELEGMLSRMEGPEGESSDMWEVNVRQPLPKRGERSADRDRARAAATMADADFALMAAEMAADTAMAAAEVEGARARVKLLERQIQRLEAALRSVDVRLSAGTTGRIADRLTLQSRIAAMQLMVEEENRMADDALSEARGRLGLGPTGELPAYAAPQPDELVPEEAAALKLSSARAAEAGAMIRMAKASANPMTAIGLRFERERTGMGNEDTVGVAFMTELPWRSRRYARAEVRAAQADRAAAHTEAIATRFRITSAVTQSRRAEQLAQTARRLSRETLERLNAEFDAMIQNASVASMGESTVLQTVELLEEATEVELQVIRADTAARTARAQLWRYAPVQLFSQITPSHSQ